jgi:GNAT superfamily N-acetyltransferase
MSSYVILPLSLSDRPWVAQFLIRLWGSPKIISRGQIHLADQLPGFYAQATETLAGFSPGERVGLITYHLQDQACEIVSIDSLVEGVGIGTQLIQQVELLVREAGYRRLWLITSNDNTPAIRFYQKRGLRLAAIHRGAIDQARRLKPEIPVTGLDGIPIRDEIEFEKLLE